MNAIRNNVRSFDEKRKVALQQKREEALKEFYLKESDELNRAFAIIKSQRITMAIQWAIISLMLIQIIFG
jgi:hypothetical protein